MYKRKKNKSIFEDETNKHAVMDILLTLPPHFAAYLRQHPGDFPSVTAVYSDPDGRKLGSGGGTVHVLWQHGMHMPVSPGSRRRIIIHSDGQSRRLPAYAPAGKSFIPFPVFKWGRGQEIDQTLFDLQLPLLKKILDRAPEGMNTLVASGDALVHADFFSPFIPRADVVCIGVWSQPETASKHGVFVVPRHDPTRLEYMLQKPSMEELQAITGNSMYLLDAGIWLLSDGAVETLSSDTGWDSDRREFRSGLPETYDLYSDFGKKLGEERELSGVLTARIVPLENAGFYHFGSNADLLRSTRKLHDSVTDQREIWHKKIKPGPEIFIQNASVTWVPGKEHASIWIENSCIPKSWTLHDHHILTGIPANEWSPDLPAGTCLDFIPVGLRRQCIRPYGFNDAMKGRAGDLPAAWLNHPMADWFAARGFTPDDMAVFTDQDIFDCPLFPVLEEGEFGTAFIQWLISSPADIAGRGNDVLRKKWLACSRFSAREIMQNTNHARLMRQRRENLKRSLPALALNYRQSVFYQLDLGHLARRFRENRLPLPPPPIAGTDVMTRVHDLMFRSSYLGKQSKTAAIELEREAFARLREGMVESLRNQPVDPVMDVHRDQILWGRSPVRLDLAGGWTDTPPYCILYGGKVVNMAVELNGQPPIQVYIRPIPVPEIVIHSIDLGVSEVVRTYAELAGAPQPGSAFAIPRAALMLAGFHPGFSVRHHRTLREQLTVFGGGLDISLMVAVPKGSGLGTSSILAATLLGVLSDFCSLGWDRHEIASRTLLLEQLLTTGGGWQDQLGGIFEGVKLIESTPGLLQRPVLSWAPDHLFTRPETRELTLLYYTGITRMARHILTDIVKGMFLNSSKHLGILQEMKHHALQTYAAIRHHDWEELTNAIRYSWELNQQLDAGTTTPEIEVMLKLIRDYAVSWKLPGAGGGGYLLIIAKDPAAAGMIRSVLRNNPPNNNARFADWKLSDTGMKLTRS